MKLKNVLAVLFLTALTLGINGCASRYAVNRMADFRDIFQFGLGLTTENPKSGVIPPTVGLYVQLTEFLNAGAVTFHGKTWEMDGRGFFSGMEDRTRIGILPYQELMIDQDYGEGSENYFKKSDTLWNDRMGSKAMRWGNASAKELNYENWSIARRQGSPIMHRGWQYWENINVEIGIPEPFITHFGLNLRLGFDPSEIFDWILGFTTFDFKKDDLNLEEFDEYLENGQVEKPNQDFKPAADEPKQIPAEALR